MTKSETYGIIIIEREVMIMITKTQYIVIDNWNKNKNWKNFKVLFILGFNLKSWQRPIWKCWRIVRNTWVNKKYLEIYEINVDKLKN